MPSRPKAQARGEVVSRTAGRASSKCEAAQAGRSGRRDRPTQVPSAQRARPWRVLRADLLQPAAVEAQEVAEPLPLAVEGRLEERGVGRGEPLDLRPALAQLLQEHGQQQGAGVVVGAVPLREVGDGVGGVLEHPRRVGQPRQVVEPPVGQLGLLLGEGAHRQRLERLVLAAEAGPLERLHVVACGLLPDHLAAQAVRLLAHRGPPRLVAAAARRSPAPAPSGRRTARAPRGRRPAAPRRASRASRRSPCRSRTSRPACPR